MCGRAWALEQVLAEASPSEAAAAAAAEAPLLLGRGLLRALADTVRLLWACLQGTEAAVGCPAGGSEVVHMDDRWPDWLHAALAAAAVAEPEAPGPSLEIGSLAPLPSWQACSVFPWHFVFTAVGWQGTIARVRARLDQYHGHQMRGSCGPGSTGDRRYMHQKCCNTASCIQMGLCATSRPFSLIQQGLQQNPFCPTVILYSPCHRERRSSN